MQHGGEREYRSTQYNRNKQEKYWKSVSTLSEADDGCRCTGRRKVNWLVVGHTGIIGHDRILLSMSKQHYTNQGIRKSKKLSINLVSREILSKADYVGSVSGAAVDKSNVFAYHIGENGTPVIDESP